MLFLEIHLGTDPSSTKRHIGLMTRLYMALAIRRSGKSGLNSTAPVVIPQSEIEFVDLRYPSTLPRLTTNSGVVRGGLNCPQRENSISSLCSPNSTRGSCGQEVALVSSFLLGLQRMTHASSSLVPSPKNISWKACSTLKTESTCSLP